MKYRYSGHTKQRAPVDGEIEADSPIEAKYKLRAMEIRPETILEARPSLSDRLSKLNDINLGSPVDLKGLLVFTRQFSTLINAGVPVVQCLDILSQQEKRKPFRKILTNVKSSIEAGSTLSGAMAEYPSVFNTLFVSLVEAGEISGTLEITLRRVGNQLEKLEKIKSKIRTAMVYPMITVVVAAAALSFLLLKVVPEVSNLYAEANAELPQITVIVLGLSTWLQENYMTLFGVTMALGFGLALALRLKPVKEVIHPLFLRTPLFGPLILKSAITTLTRTLSTLVSSGVPLLVAFDICAKLMSNLEMRRIIEGTAAMVSEGKSVAFGLSQYKIFPPMVVHMVSIGEVTGKLDELLGKVADMFEEEVDEAVTILTGLIQPALIIVVGALIAFMLLAMYLPIFQLAEKVTGGL